MKDVKTLKNQNIIDITLQTKGDFQQLFEVALANGISINEATNAGTRLIIPQSEENVDILRFYKVKKTIPATAHSAADAYIQKLFENGFFQPGLFE